MPQTTSMDSPRITELKRRLATEPSSRLFLDLAREYHESGQLEAAADVCARGLRKHPTYLSARVLLGRILFEMGKASESRDEMEAVLAQAPDNLVARRVLAELCLEQGDRAGALDRFRALLAFNPADAQARSRIEEIERQLAGGEAPAATMAPAATPARPATTAPAAPIESAARVESGALATPTLAELYLQQGLTDKAISVYREILQGDPSHAEARARLDELNRPEPRPDPGRALRMRKVAALRAWVAAIRRGGSRVERALG